MPILEMTSESRSFGGWQRNYAHASSETGTAMTFSLFLPPAAEQGVVPALMWLSGLTCTPENFTVKAGAQRRAAELGLALIMPDTSPRGTDLPGEHDSYDFGSGAGFYVDATEAPWSDHYRLYSYMTRELPDLLFGGELPLDRQRLSISGHSMGGHGALVIGLREAAMFRSVSAFAPIANPMECPWGQKAFTGYLGDDPGRWAAYDACHLIRSGHRRGEILVDQGMADPFLVEQLKPDALEAACAEAQQPLTLRRQEGYDHSYFFISTFIDDHLDWHATHLT